MKLIKFLSILILLIIPISCQVLFNPKSIKNDKYSITFEWDINDPNYYSKWIIYKIDKTNLDMKFTCDVSSDANSRICIFTTNENNYKQFYGYNITTCYNISATIEKCEGLLMNEHYPSPIITSAINPNVDGQIVLLNGYFLKLTNDLAYSPIPVNKDDLLSTTFDPTNFNISIKPGCGSSSLTWISGRNPFQFNYQSPTINVNGSGLSTDGTMVNLFGTNFCNSSNSIIQIHVGNDLIPQSLITIVSSTEIKFDPNQEYSSSSKSISVGSSNSMNLDFRPVPQFTNSVPHDGGLVEIKGKRLKSISSNALININSVECVVQNNTATFVSCQIAPSYSGAYDIDLRVDNIPSSPKLVFVFDIPSLFEFNSRMQNGTTFTFLGECLGDNSTSKLYLTPKNQPSIDLTQFTVVKNQTSITFEIMGNYSGQVTISVFVGSLSTNLTFTPNVFATPDYSKSTNSTNFPFKLYYDTLDPNGSPPKIHINDLELTGTNDDGRLVDPDDGSVSYFFPGFPPICSPTLFELKANDQSFNGTIKSQIPVLTLCTIQGSITTCVGKNFGGENFASQVNITFANQTITPININDTMLTFETLDTFYASNLTINTCTHLTFYNYILEPVYLFTNASNLDVNGGNVYVWGKYFAKNTEPLITCITTKQKCYFQNSTTLLCPLIINGPYDIECSITFNSKDLIFTATFHGPQPLSTTSVTIGGGLVYIYGKYLYKQIDSITIGTLGCENPQFKNFSYIERYSNEKMTQSYVTCVLPPQTDENLYDIPLLNVTLSIAGKSSSKYIFSYTRFYAPLVASNNSIHPLVFISSVIILIGLLSIFIKFILNRCNGKNRKKTKLDSKMIEKQLQEPLRRQMTEAQLIPESRTSTLYPNY